MILSKASLCPNGNSAFPLLRLPGEIRNLIYEYALTNEYGAYYRKEPGVKPKLYPARRACYELNRLKYVCRQLYIETAGIELKFNTILFSCFLPAVKNMTEIAAADQFLTFVCPDPPLCNWSISSGWTNTLRKVIISTKDALPLGPGNTPSEKADNKVGSATRRLIKFCDTHPSASVYFEHPIFTSTRGILNFLLIGAFLHAACRNKTLGEICTRLFIPMVMSGARLLHGEVTVLQIREYYLKDTSMPDNLKLMPMAASIRGFDENRFRKKFDGDLQVIPGSMRQQFEDMGGFKHWVDTVREWYVNGV
jgi:hypothetical protein